MLASYNLPFTFYNLQLVMRFLLFIFSVVFFIACDAPKPQNAAFIVPKSTNIDQNKMALILMQLHLAEARVNEDSRQALDSLRFAKPLPEYYKTVLGINGVTETEFQQAFNYYLNDQKKLDEIYTKVIEKISTLDARVRER
jgi:hypothetical protein